MRTTTAEALEIFIGRAPSQEELLEAAEPMGYTLKKMNKYLNGWIDDMPFVTLLVLLDVCGADYREFLRAYEPELAEHNSCNK